MRRREYLTKIGKVRKNGSIKHTFATTFLLPTIGYCVREFNNKLINVHIDENFDEPAIYIISDCPEDVEDATKALKSNPIYLEHSVSEDKSEMIIKFKIPVVDHNVFNKFINGKYSEFDNEYKQILTKIYSKKVDPTGLFVTEYDVIYPRKEKRMQIAKELGVNIDIIPEEVFDPPDLSYEIYKPIEQLIQQLDAKERS